MSTCPRCGQSLIAAPEEPPIGTWMRATKPRSRHAKRAVFLRFIDADGNDGWSEPGFYAVGKWECVWEAWGPLEPCGPWGADL